MEENKNEKNPPSLGATEDSPTSLGAAQGMEASEELRECQKISQQNLEGWQRALADYQNIKKELERSVPESMEFGAIRVMEKMIPIVGHFQNAVEHIPKEDQKLAWVQGIIYIKKYFEDALNELGLARIETVGKPFNPMEHEVLSEEESEGESGLITKEVSPGFKKGNKVVVAAKVIVRK